MTLPESVVLFACKLGTSLDASPELLIEIEELSVVVLTEGPDNASFLVLK